SRRRQDFCAGLRARLSHPHRRNRPGGALTPNVKNQSPDPARWDRKRARERQIPSILMELAMSRSRAVFSASLVGLLLVAAPLLVDPAVAQTASPPACDAKTLTECTPNSGDTAWMLTSMALVLMMTVPGLGLFYGGLVRKKNVGDTVMP